MKSKVALLSLASFLFAFAASAQGIENDDMYFNSKDRAKLVAAKASEASYSASIKKSKREKENEAEEPVNPTDSYSARNVNPEYEARSNSEAAQVDDEDYFVNNYRYNTASNFNNFNNNFNRWYSNPWYGGNYYDPYINSWNSPYYGSYYDVWGNPWRNPYYRSGWSSSFSYHWGSSWNYGWGMNFGWGNYGYNPYWGDWGWGSRYNYYYPNTIVIVNNNDNGGRGVVYGKRATTSRSSISRDNSMNTGSRTRSTTVNPTPRSSDENIGGRVSTSTNRRQEEYYNRSWRSTNSQNSAPSRSSSRSYNNTNSDWSNGNASRSSSFENTQRSRSYESPAPSRSYDSGGGSRSSSGSTGSSSSSGGSRGRTRP